MALLARIALLFFVELGQAVLVKIVENMARKTPTLLGWGQKAKAKVKTMIRREA